MNVLAHHLFVEAFAKPRDPRSDEYMQGVRAALEFRAEHVHIRLPYDLGTALADAFLAGTDEGHAIWRRHQEAANAALTPHLA